MADQPKEDESQDNVGTGAEISAENDATAHFPEVPVEDESQDNTGTGAALSTDNDVPAVLYDGSSCEAETRASAAVAEAAKGFMDTLAELPGGAPQSSPTVALDSPSAAQHRRSSAIFPLRADTSLTDAAATPTVAGAEAEN